MVVKDDHTFTFSQRVPFLQNKNGDWFYCMDGDMEVLECTFDGIRMQEIQMSYSNAWLFKGESLLDSSVGNRIVFRPNK
ncbi:hypothetical protein ABIB50_002392 [Mucilaginibacter sp. UYCu711]